MSRRGRDFFEHVVAFDQFAEGGVLMVQLSRIAVADEKLASGGIGILGTGHGDHAANVGMVVEFRGDFVAGIAGAPHGFLRRIFGEGIAALDHEAFDDAVETGSIVKTFFREVGEIFDVTGRDIRPKFENHFADIGGKNCNFAHKIIFWFFIG
jgi:hypothetical protein